MDAIETAQMIKAKAMRYDCYDEIAHMEPVDKVRFIQTREGFTPCFGWDEPLKSSREARLLCAITDCCWRESCNYLRCLTAVPWQGGVGESSAGDWSPGFGGGEVY